MDQSTGWSKASDAQEIVSLHSTAAQLPPSVTSRRRIQKPFSCQYFAATCRQLLSSPTRYCTLYKHSLTRSKWLVQQFFPYPSAWRASPQQHWWLAVLGTVGVARLACHQHLWKSGPAGPLCVKKGPQIIIKSNDQCEGKPTQWGMNTAQWSSFSIFIVRHE